MKKNTVLIFYILLGITFWSYGQSTSMRDGACTTQPKAFCPKNTFFHETNSNFSEFNFNSLNYDRIIKCDWSRMMSIRLGVIYYSFDKISSAGAIVELNSIRGSGSFLLEIGLGADFLYIYKNYNDSIGKYSDDVPYLAVTGRLGLRFQRDKGLFFRIGFTPVFSVYNQDLIPIISKNSFIPMAGFGAGYTLKNY